MASDEEWDDAVQGLIADRDAAIAERDRLRDLNRRLARIVKADRDVEHWITEHWPDDMPPREMVDEQREARATVSDDDLRSVLDAASGGEG